MQKGHGPSWQVRCDFPEYLQLSGYIAQLEGFRPDTNSREASLAEIEWQLWWEALLLPPEPFAILPNQTDPLRRVNYDPPDFARLAHWPAIQSLCQRHFPDFNRRWGTVGGDKELMTTLLDEQCKRLRIDNVVSACVAAAGKRASSPFILAVDFVVWPHDFIRFSGDHYVILGREYLDPQNAEHEAALRAILQEVISKLV